MTSFHTPALHLSLRHMKRANVDVCVLCLHVMSVKERVKGVNYIFPQGSTQWKVVEGLLIHESHLQKKSYEIKEGQGGETQTADAGASCHFNEDTEQKQAWNEVRGNKQTTSLLI